MHFFLDKDHTCIRGYTEGRKWNRNREEEKSWFCGRPLAAGSRCACPCTWASRPATLFIFHFSSSNFLSSTFFSSLTFYHEIYIKIFFSKFSISEFFAGLFFILNLSCTKILHHDFSFQKLSMSKYSSPNFMKSFCQRFFFQFFFKVLFIIVSRLFVSLDPGNRTRWRDVRVQDTGNSGIRN